MCGNLNVAHKEIDIKNYKTNKKSVVFTIEERNKMTKLLDSRYIDTFRYFYPDKSDAYSWWSYMAKARNNNIGWKIDYFLVSDDFEKNIKGAEIDSEIYGSDHCPVILYLK